MPADAFASEKAVIRRGEELLAGDESGLDFREEYRILLKNYSKLFKMSRLLMRMSDRSQRQLQEAEEALALANQRMEKELNVGQEIQMAMLPGAFPAFPHVNTFSIAASIVPAREVGGDFYDFYMLDPNRLCFCIGDVSGKGVPAALFMAVTQTLIKSAAGIENSTAAIMTHVNEELSRGNDACMFVTIFTGILHIDTAELLYTNAGHNPPFIRHPDGTTVLLGQRHGPAVGAVRGVCYREDRVRLSPADLLFLFTDGVTEARNTEGKFLGDSILRDLAGTHCFSTPETAVGSTFDAVREFEAGSERSDDITVLALSYIGNSSKAAGLFKMRIKSHLEEIPGLNAAFNRFAAEYSVPVDIIRKINLVFDELLSNVISYTLNRTGTHDIGITVHVKGQDMTVTISYEGPEFDPVQVPEPDVNLMLDERAEGGLGIFLVKSLMDEFIYRRVGSRNVITIRKKIPEKHERKSTDEHNIF